MPSAPRFVEVNVHVSASERNVSTERGKGMVRGRPLSVLADLFVNSIPEEETKRAARAARGGDKRSPLSVLADLFVTPIC